MLLGCWSDVGIEGCGRRRWFKHVSIATAAAWMACYLLNPSG